MCWRSAGLSPTPMPWRRFGRWPRRGASTQGAWSAPATLSPIAASRPGRWRPSETSATGHAESPPSSSQLVKLDDREQAILDAVGNGEEEVEHISAATALEPGRVTALLTNLQLRGLIKRLPGGRFVPRAWQAT